MNCFENFKARFSPWLLAILSLSGCVWSGYETVPPINSSWSAPEVAGRPTLSGYLYEPNDRQQLAIREVAPVVFEIFRDPSFQKMVGDYNGWLSHADQCISPMAHGTPPVLSVPGHVVVDTVLNHSFSGVHYLTNTFLFAIATSSPGGARRGTSIRPFQIEKWWNKDPKIRAEFVDTIAHELAHLIPLRDGSPDDGFSRYQDGGHDTCTERSLVSYRLGDLTGCFYRHEQGVKNDQGRPETIDECMEGIRPLSLDDIQKCTETLDSLKGSCP